MIKKRFKFNGISYILNDDHKVASLVNNTELSGDILIPRSIINQNQEYVITSIEEGSFSFSEIKSIQFEDNSELEIIDEKAFYNSSLKSISLPKSVTKISPYSFACCLKLQEFIIPENSKLKVIESNAFFGSPIESIFIPSDLKYSQENWFNGLMKLTKFKVSPKSQSFFNYQDNYILGKNEEDQYYEILLFARRDIIRAAIPSFVEQIAPHSFEFCKSIQKVSFSNDSNLKIIQKYAFSNSALQTITIPKTVLKICEYAFYWCHYFKRVCFDIDSELKIIEKCAFGNSSLESIIIPSKVETIELIAFSNCKNLLAIEIEENSSMKSIVTDTSIETFQAIIFFPVKSKIRFE